MFPASPEPARCSATSCSSWRSPDRTFPFPSRPVWSGPKSARCPVNFPRPPARRRSRSSLSTERSRITACRHDHRGAPDPASLRVAGRTSDPVRVIFPADGDIFKIDSVLRPEYQTLRFQARIDARPMPETVEWHLDGVRAAVVGPPFAWSWKLRPGSYTIHLRAIVEGKIVESRRVKIRVLTDIRRPSRPNPGRKEIR